jgi:tRNA 2-thiouridine synthesizing protein A
MQAHKLDTRGVRCPQPILKVTSMLPSIEAGDLLEVVADCPTFESDIQKWCDRMHKALLAVSRDGDEITAQIQF